VPLAGGWSLPGGDIVANQIGNSTFQSITLAADPTIPLGAATKEYVDARGMGYVSKIRNGTFDVWQRGTSLTIATAGPYFAADGWAVYPTGANVTVVKTTATGVRSSNAMWITGAAGNTDVTIAQRIESMIAAQIGSVAFTFQALIGNSTGGSITPQIIISHPTGAGGADDWSASVTDLPRTNLQVCPTSAWTRVAYTFSIPAATIALGLQIGLDFGGLAASQSVGIAEADLRATPGLAVGLQANPPPPELRPISEEMVFCKRYYQLVGGGAGTTILIQGYANAGSAYAQTIHYQEMRALPTAGTVGTFTSSNVGTINYTPGPRSMGLQVNPPAAGAFYWYNTNANSYLTLSAEL
jgi:hypothetical protein